MGSTASVHQLIHLPVDVLHARVGNGRRYAADLAGFSENLARRRGIKSLCQPPGENATGEVVDSGTAGLGVRR